MQVGSQFFNLRLVAGDVSDALSGYSHNAVTPVGMATRLPIILSHKIAALQPDFFWLGGGEVDLKVRCLERLFALLRILAVTSAACTDCTPLLLRVLSL